MSFCSMDITSSNAEAVLTVAELYPNGIVLEGFSVDQSVGTESIQVAEVRMGVDGKMVAGYTPNPIIVTIGLEPNERCAKDLVNYWLNKQTNNRIYECTLVLTIPSIHTVFTLSGGTITDCTPLPSLKKVLDPTTWKFAFAKLDKADLG